MRSSRRCCIMSYKAEILSCVAEGEGKGEDRWWWSNKEGGNGGGDSGGGAVEEDMWLM